MSNYQEESPFLYQIGWTDLNIWYLGVKFARGCRPLDLWTSYFTSSVLVSEIRELYGEPDLVEILATGSISDMRKLESLVIKDLRLHRNSRWLNRCSRIACDPDFMTQLWADPVHRANRTAKIKATTVAKYGKLYVLDGVAKSAEDWANEYPIITAQQLRCRMSQGWNLQQALTVPPRRRAITGPYK